MFTKKKPLAFIKKAPVKPDVENAADAKKPGDAKDAKVATPVIAGNPKKPVKKGKGASFFANKAASALANK